MFSDSNTPAPTATDLAAIEAEWPLIEAELAVVAAECRLAVSPDALSVRAHRRAVATLATVLRQQRRQSRDLPSTPITAA